MNILLICNTYQSSVYGTIIQHLFPEDAIYCLCNSAIYESNMKQIVSDDIFFNNLNLFDLIISTSDKVLSDSMQAIIKEKRKKGSQFIEVQFDRPCIESDELLTRDFSNLPVILLLYEGLSSQNELVEIQLKQILIQEKYRVFHYPSTHLKNIVKALECFSKSRIPATLESDFKANIAIVTMPAFFIFEKTTQKNCNDIIDHISPDFLIICAESKSNGYIDLEKYLKVSYGLHTDIITMSDFRTYENNHGLHVHVENENPIITPLVKVDKDCAGIIYGEIVEKLYFPENIHRVALEE